MAAGDVDVALTQPSSESCASFDGVDDEITFTNSPIIQLTSNNDFSICGWVKCKAGAAGSADNIISFQPASLRGIGVQRSVDSARFDFVMRTDGEVSSIATSSNSLVNNVWTHFTATFTSSTTGLNFYIDGVSAGTPTTHTDTTLTPTSISIAGNNVTSGTASFFEGLLRDLRVYNRVLSSSEITRVARGELITNGLVGHWKLNGNALDSSGNGNNGTVTGATFINDSGDLDTAVTAQRVTTGATNTFLIADTMNGQQVITAGITEA